MNSLNSTPKVSVVLPVFNGKKYLDECIRSVLSQTMADFEVLIGDDCSTDGSREVIESFADDRIRYFRRDKNLGVAGNVNRLLKIARGEIARFFCQDDVLEKHCLETEIAFFDAHPDIGISFCGAVSINEGGKVIREWAVGGLPEVVHSSLCLQLFYYHGCLPGNGSTVCVRKKCFEEVGFWDESFHVAQDFEMWVRICERKNLGVIPKRLVRIRSHPGQQSRASATGVKYIAETRRIRRILLEMLPGEIRPWARLYAGLRQNVLDTHYSVRCVLQGRVGDFLKIVRVMGLRDFSFGLLCWFLTLNNHFYRPRPKLV